MGFNSSDDVESYPSEVDARHGSVPAFLKVTYVAFALFAVAYLWLYFQGDGTRLVRQLNEETRGAAAEAK